MHWLRLLFRFVFGLLVDFGADWLVILVDLVG